MSTDSSSQTTRVNAGKPDEAVACFKSGFNCAQSLFSTYSTELGLDKTTALLVSCGLGGGMGRLQETCGAVTGAYLLIGLKHGMTSAEDSHKKDHTYSLVREFDRLFKERHPSTNCRELLGVDLLTGDKQLIAEKHESICPALIHDSVEIIESLIFA
jgi:C_GCAxxG_C_C family probable redox protein